MANSADPDQTAPLEGLHCLSKNLGSLRYISLETTLVKLAKDSKLILPHKTYISTTAFKSHGRKYVMDYKWLNLPK